MAFDRPIEADSVKDFGLLTSLIRAPVVGILWLLGGEQAKEDEDRDRRGNKSMPMENQRLGNAIIDGDTSCGEGMIENGKSGTSNTDEKPDLKLAHVNVNDDVPPVPPGTSSSSVTSINPIHNKENKSYSPQRPTNSSIKDLAACKRRQVHPKINARQTSSCHASSLFHAKPDILDADAATEMIDDLVAVMERSHVRTSGLAGPATDAFLTSHSIVAPSSAMSLSASYSATTFSTSHPSQNITNCTHTSQLTQNESYPSIRGNKKMSWSDEGGNRSLVEYFDDTSHLPRSKHWSAMKRNTTCTSESRHSFDGTERGLGSQRSDVKVIKSALKRCGSYSPPGSMYANRSGDASNSGSADSSTSSPNMKSFRSISMIGSSDSSRSASQDTDDSMVAVTDKFVNSNECVPSTLQFGCGQACGGLIIPRGGPSDPRNYCPSGTNDSRYQLILGAGPPSPRDQNASESIGGTIQDVSAVNASVVRNPVASTKSGSNNSPGNHHHFLPRHGNGYVSPQYGFYVNITPPTPELYAAKVWDQTSKHVLQQQSYLQFQYHAPSPIPEGSPEILEGVIPQRFVGRSSVPRPSSSRSSYQEQPGLKESAKQKSLKPTFTKNKKGMGMLLAENSHHGVWPTVPFG